MSKRPNIGGRLGITMSRRRILSTAGATSFLAIFTILGLDRLSSSGDSGDANAAATVGSDLRGRFDYLSTHGNSNCSAQFLSSIPKMADDLRLQGSCCSPMAFERYVKQVDGLATYSTIPEIPPDPYDISAGLAKRLLQFGTEIAATAEEQRILDQAVADSDEKGYCCCRCWRWSVYEGLSKYLVRSEHFTAGQITDVLNNSDGCGGGA